MPKIWISSILQSMVELRTLISLRVKMFNMDIRNWFVILGMKNKPVDRKIRILRTLLSGDMTVNNIFAKTGLSWKKSITDAIKELEAAELIAERKDPGHSQKEVMYLTKSGRELADMIISLDEYAKSI